MNYLFIIQGEGRGHLSQAVAYREKLEDNGDKLVSVFMGKSSQREIPSYAEESLGVKVKTFRSPNFVRSGDRKGILPGLSIFYNLILSPVFFISIFKLRRQIKRTDVDRIVNFYDLIAGLAAWLSFSNKPIISISHHYFLERGNFRFPSNHFFLRHFLIFHNHICSLGSTEIQALSFTPGERIGKINITPPLIRRRILEISTENQGFILVYLLNEGFLSTIFSLADKYPNLLFKVFTQAKHSDFTTQNIVIRKPDPAIFIRELAKCKALITTAGFESQCEGAFLGKLVFTLPAKNHFEQVCNSLDGARSGISRSLKHFDPDLNPDMKKIKEFRNWCLSSLKLDHLKNNLNKS